MNASIALIAALGALVAPYVYVTILVNCVLFSWAARKKTILSISSTFHILAHTLRVFSGHSASLFGNFDNLPNLDILLILGFFYINLTRRSGKLSQNCLS